MTIFQPLIAFILRKKFSSLIDIEHSDTLIKFLLHNYWNIVIGRVQKTSFVFFMCVYL